jgi:carboxypeptidase Q
MNFGTVLAALATASILTACHESGADTPATHFSAKQMATAASLRDAALENSGTWEILEELVSVAPKRLAGSRGDELARDWAVEKLESLGFDRVWVQEFKLLGWERLSADATVLGDEGIDLDITSLGRSISTPDGGVTAQVVHFPTFADLEAAAASDVEGKIVFISNRMERKIDGSGYGPANVARSHGHDVVAQKGGLALLIRSIGTDSHDAPHTGAMIFGENGMSQPELDRAYDEAVSSPYGELTVAAGAISNVDSDLLEAMFDAGKEVTVALEIRNNDLGEITSYNIIGEMTGSKRPREVVITGGHIDAWDTGVGAMDDGMGVAITMNAVASIGALSRRPARTLRFVAFGAEELGLLGAKAYAEEYRDVDHVFGIESDFGIGKVWQLSPAVTDDAVPVLAEISTVLEPMGIAWDPEARGFPGPDLTPLVTGEGLAGASLNGDGTFYFDLHHTAEDTLDKIKASDLDYNTAAYAALLYLVAEYDGRLDAKEP